MNLENEKFLSLHAPPARLTATEAAWFLGFSPHEIPILISAGLLKPLGHPPVNGSKFFGSATLAELRQDLKWLSRASDAVVEHWKDKNARKTPGHGWRKDHAPTFAHNSKFVTEDRAWSSCRKEKLDQPAGTAARS